ncbi:hypothetical protein WA026_009255 [Henosepilachna vigintioctopunctata]|uniref:Secreted protein n=1 Tax=Henosepilachna vigintioctopunctata TaxID=420089 RepID=A0AAW1UYU9_9CUCU
MMVGAVHLLCCFISVLPQFSFHTLDLNCYCLLFPLYRCVESLYISTIVTSSILFSDAVDRFVKKFSDNPGNNFQFC